VRVEVKENGNACSKRGDLRQRQVYEDDFAPDDVQAEIDQQRRKDQARDQRPFHYSENFAHNYFFGS